MDKLALFSLRADVVKSLNQFKYKTNQQYGPSTAEIVNLHYTALILRTADLLHITSDRTPSIEFNLINPTDPISQEEWAKQRAVKVIRPKIKKNKEGNADDSIAKDTFEIIADFEIEQGFFGLISYINYVRKQLKDNFKFNEFANKQSGTNFNYPWRDVDDSSIQAKDFEKKQFEFTLDQTKILDLLIGHTLYNDSSVVLRELTQNGIDASKLKKYELEKEGEKGYSPEIKVIWNDKDRELSFIDNGTGMTLEIIQNHLLKVGSSRYQDESFKKQYPDFSPISRFGIGLLTCFLIADDIDITTKSSDSEKAILLKIRKVHGKYLLRHLPIDKINNDIKKHGTEIKLFVRADVDLSNIEKELKKWILLPQCKLQLEVNGNIMNIGFDSPKELLETHLKEMGYNIDNKDIKIKEVEKDGITMAFALRYIEYWKEWDFLECRYDGNHTLPIGICIEGIRVDFDTPGFNGRNLYVIANTSGKNAPKTNVARSNIEITPEREALLFSIYQLYLDHISNELNNLLKDNSITWAASEAIWLLKTFVKSKSKSLWDNDNDGSMLVDFDSFCKALSCVKCILIEKNSNREIISINQLKELGHFWTIDCASYSSANSLIKEIKSSNTSALVLLNTIFGSGDSNINHIDYLLCNQQSNTIIDKMIRENFQVDSIKLIPEQRRLDLKWSINNEKIWEEILIHDSGYRSMSSRCYVQLKEIEMEESISQIAINSSSAFFILRNSKLNEYLVKLINLFPNKSQEDTTILSQIVSLLNNFFYYKNLDRVRVEEIIDSNFERNKKFDDEKIIWSKIDREELISTILETNFIKYDMMVWYRRDMY